MSKILDKIQENLYSRQIGTYGEEAMKKIMNLQILILGLKGLGIEVAKNIILTGPQKVLLYDPNIVKLKDLGLNYYLNEKDENKKRIDYSCLNSLAKLNPYTKVEILEVNEKANNFYEALEMNKFDVIVETELISQNEIINLNEYCRKNKIKFIYAANMGLTGFIFSDFGYEHLIYDIDGEEPKKYMIKDIKSEEKGQITYVDEDDNPFNLDEGDYIIFKNVKGMVELNDNKPRKIDKIINKKIYINDNLKNYHKYEGNGDIYEYKKIKKINYKSYKDSIELPFKKEKGNENFTEQIENKLHENKLNLSIIITIGQYFDKIKNLENLKENNDIIEEITKEIKQNFFRMIAHEREIGIDNSDYEENEIQKFEDKNINNIICFSKYNLIPMCSLIGGYLSQEIIKSIGKYSPINQWMFFNFYNENFKYGIHKNKNSNNNRYHDQTSIFGDEIQKQLSNLKVFACGAGAVGCELLKNLAFMGVSTGDGCVTISDYDFIENSNLNRQFLFNNENINQPKSKVACDSIKKMNKDFKCKDYQLKVSKETENVFNDSFWKSQDLIISGVDDDKARLYLNDQCFKYNKILINIGTSGVRAKGDIVIPKITYPLSIDLDEGEQSINICTIKKFPYKIEHCIQWSQNIFHRLFNENILLFNSFVTSGEDFIIKLSKEPEDVILEKYETIRLISEVLITDDNYEKLCKIINIGIYCLYLLFIKSIESLLKYNPLDLKENDIPFWSGIRKKPSPLSLHSNDEMINQFLYSFNSIFCQCLNIQINDFYKNDNFNKYIENEFTSYKNKKVNDAMNTELEKIFSKLNELKIQINELKDTNIILNLIEFEKDSLNNNHLEFIQSCSNLRARNYNIQEESKNKVLMIVGKIIASVPTSTSSIVGYISLQIINLLYTHDTENIVKNIFINLGLNVMDLIPQQKIKGDLKEEIKIKEKENISIYPKIEIKGSKTCKEFLEYILDNYNYEIFHFEINEKIIYDKRVTKDPEKIRRELERKEKKLENLYFEIMKKSNENFKLTEKKFKIKVFCRKNNESNKIVENLYNFPLIDYIID